MKQLTILVPNGYHNLSSVVGTYEVFLKANAFYQSLGRKPVFKVTLASTSKTVKLHDNLFAIRPHQQIAEITRTDLVIIPAVRPDFSKSIRQTKALSQWLIEMHDKGAE